MATPRAWEWSLVGERREHRPAIAESQVEASVCEIASNGIAGFAKHIRTRRESGRYDAALCIDSHIRRAAAWVVVQVPGR